LPQLFSDLATYLLKPKELENVGHHDGNSTECDTCATPAAYFMILKFMVT
jgi:hypothetical protein